MTPEFKIGDRVRWQYRGEERTGWVVEVVEPNGQPMQVALAPVERLSYIVETECGRRYRPLDLDPVKTWTWSECAVDFGERIRCAGVTVDQLRIPVNASNFEGDCESADTVMKRTDALHFATLAFYGAAFALAVAVAAIFIAIRGM